MKNKGFTLTELTIVMAIIAALTVAVLTWFLTFKDTKQKDKNGGVTPQKPVERQSMQA